MSFVTNKSSNRCVLLVVAGVCAVCVALLIAYLVLSSGTPDSPAPSPKKDVPSTQSDTNPTSAKIPLHSVTIPVSAKGLDEDGSRIPVHVDGNANDGEATSLDTYLEYDGTGLELPPGTYTVVITASPIASDGTLYALPHAKASIQLAEGDTSSSASPKDDAALTLTPQDPVDVTEDELNEAATAIRADPQRKDRAEPLIQAAERLRKDAIKAKEDEARRQKEKEKEKERIEVVLGATTITLPPLPANVTYDANKTLCMCEGLSIIMLNDGVSQQLVEFANHVAPTATFALADDGHAEIYMGEDDAYFALVTLGDGRRATLTTIAPGGYVREGGFGSLSEQAYANYVSAMAQMAGMSSDDTPESLAVGLLQVLAKDVKATPGTPGPQAVQAITPQMVEGTYRTDGSDGSYSFYEELRVTAAEGSDIVFDLEYGNSGLAQPYAVYGIGATLDENGHASAQFSDDGWMNAGVIELQFSQDGTVFVSGHYTQTGPRNRAQLVSPEGVTLQRQ